jgi:hypothetical protein
MKMRTATEEAALQRLRGYLDETEPKVILWLLALWKRQRRDVTPDALKKALSSGKLPEGWMERWQKDYEEIMDDRIAPLLALAMLEGARDYMRTRPGFLFSASDALVRAYVEKRGAKLAAHFAEEQGRALLAVIRSNREDLDAERLAKAVLSMIGLTKPQAIANLALYKAVFDELRREMGVDRVKAEIRAREAARKFAVSQTRQRALTVARTELASAYNQGAYDIIRRAQKEGVAGDFTKTWLTARDERVCKHICAPLDGVTVGMNKPFVVRGESVGLVPPAHVNCRCAVMFKEV